MQRRLAILGDSISTYAGCNPSGFAVYYEGERARAAGVASPRDTWWHRAASQLGAQVVANGSYSGSMVAGAGFPAAWSPERVASLKGPAGEKPTDILVFLGTNDYGWGGCANQAAGHSAATPAAAAAHAPAEVRVAVGEQELREFADAYALLLDRLHEAYGPDAALWCLTLLPGRVAGAAGPTFTANLRGVPLSSYNVAIAEAARSHNARVADIAAFGLDYEAVDGTHPTARGMEQLAALVVAALEGRPAPDPAPFGGDLALWASRELCPGRSCAGCACAQNTGDVWTCVCQRAVSADSHA